GEPIAPYIDAFGVDLFLSKDESIVQAVIDSNSNCAAAVIYEPPTEINPASNVVRIAFDAEAVLFNEESELRFKK
ncbi:MAG: 5'-nucleotidase, partial [Bacteroidales bacterium]|nr:5'-nucleotidase [Bacteroidales bacterium]